MFSVVITAQEDGVQFGEFNIAASVAEGIELLAIIIIAGAVVVAGIGAVLERTRTDWRTSFQTFKMYMARGLMMGLDLLIAADIIKTVTLDPTLENVLVLAILVLVRTFLSWSLVVETEGRWPWQPEVANSPGT